VLSDDGLSSSALAFGCRQYVLTVRPRCLRHVIRSARHERCLVSSRQKAGLQRCRPLCTAPCDQRQPKPDDVMLHKFTLIYKFPAIRFLRVVSRLKLLQTGITFLLLPPVYYLYFQGQVTYSLVSYSTGIAVFAAIMLYSLSHYLRRFVGMIYLDHSETTLKISHLTFWGKRQDLYVPVNDIMTLADTGDSRNEVLLCLKRYSSPDILYFSTQLGQVVDKNAFKQIFGGMS
uniref:Transmembrane protein 186 n=1 Tax=Scleropages formosus TaxID=113540 RepID=A0A8D0CJN7_SCLFO